MAAAPSSPEVVRAVGWISLAAISLNSMIGAGIFTLPAAAVQLLGRAAPLAYLAAGVAVILIALCFADAGSRFERSGGPYLYAREAFGPFVAFEVGWAFVLTRITAVAAVSNTFADYLGYFLQAMSKGVGHAVTVTILIATFSAVNYAGIRPGVWVINALTIGKLFPLLTFCVVGAFFIDPRSFSFSTLPPPGSLQQASLLLVFAFGGFENASVPSAEVIQPRRVVPLAVLSSVGLVVALYLAIQLVAMGTLPALAGSATPLASAAQTFLGPAGGSLLTLGALLSVSGNTSASILIGSRLIHALALGGQLPPILARIHSRNRTPSASILLFALVAWALAVSGTFVQMAALSAMGRLLYYATTCAAVPVLRRRTPSGERVFTLAGGALIPMLALGICVWLLTGSSWRQAAMTAAALLAGALLYAIFARGRQ